MKKLYIYFFLVLFSLQTPSQADDIQDIQIEGISVGDSLLDYLTKKKIKKLEKQYYRKSKKYVRLYKVKKSKELLEYDYVFYTDGDIVFENNFCIQYLVDNLHDCDMLVQNNGNKDFCAGFMFLKSNDTILELFDTKDQKEGVSAFLEKRPPKWRNA